MTKEITEIWKPCPEYEEYYEVSNLGRVRNLSRNKFLKPRLDRKGYLKVGLSINGKSTTKTVHRLVMKAFVDNVENLPQINHKNANKQNNCITNLEWSNNSRNQLHAYKSGLQPSRCGEKNSRAKITDDDVTLFKNFYNSGVSLSDSAKQVNIGLAIARNIIYGRTWKSNTIPILKRDERLINIK